MGDLLGDGSTLHDFSWQGDNPAKIEEEVILPSGGIRRDNLTDANDDADKISLAGSVAGGAGDQPQLNPFTPEWFAQVIGAAATAAATAVANSSRQPTLSTPPTTSSSSAPRRLNERKIPDFWEDRPEFWFRIFDAHLSHFSPSDQKCFDTLLPLLTPGARSVVHSVIRTPGGLPYTRAREALLRHYGKTPRQLAREIFDTRALGDRLPSEYLDHILGLLPDVKKLFEVMLLDAVPANARVAALQHTDLRDMAAAADAVVLENRVSAQSDRYPSPAPAVNHVSLLDGDLVGAAAFPPPLAPVSNPQVTAVSRSGANDKKSDSLCLNHARWGKDTFRCLKPNSCRMRRFLRPKPPQQQQQHSQGATSSSGNGPAGGRQ